MADGQDPNAVEGGNQDTASLKAELRAEVEAELRSEYQGMISSARDEAAARRKKLQEKDAEFRALAEEQGQFKALYEKALEQHKELETEFSTQTEKMSALAQKAELWDGYQAAELERVESRKANLPDNVVAQLDAVGDLTAKLAILSVYDAATSGATVKKAAGAGSGGGPALSPGTPISANPSVEELKALQQSDPKAFAHKIGMNGAGGGGGIFSRFRGGQG